MYFLAGAKKLDRLREAKVFIRAVKKFPFDSAWDQKLDKIQWFSYPQLGLHWIWMET